MDGLRQGCPFFFIAGFLIAPSMALVRIGKGFGRRSAFEIGAPPSLGGDARRRTLQVQEVRHIR